jgi:phospholipid transport system substrate-binding protein
MKMTGKNKTIVTVAAFLIFEVLAIGAFISSATGAAATVEPLDRVKKVVDEIIQVLKDKALAKPGMKEVRRHKVERLADGLFDFQEMGKRALGAAWDKATPEEKKEFVPLFADLVKERYIGKIDTYSGQKVEFKRQAVRGKAARVYSVLLDKGTEVPIDYSLVDKDGQWVAYDLQIENVSLVANYRRDFSSIVKNEGLSGLLTKMREKIQNFGAEK